MQQIYFCLQHADKVTNVKSPKKQQKDSIEFQKYDSDLVSQLKSKNNNKKKKTEQQCKATENYIQSTISET